MFNCRSQFCLKWIHFKVKLGYVFVAMIIIGGLAIITIIAAVQTPAERTGWTINFIQSLLQDIFVNPLVTLLSQYYFIKAVESRYVKSKPKLRRKLVGYLDEALWEINVYLSLINEAYNCIGSSEEIRSWREA